MVNGLTEEIVDCVESHADEELQFVIDICNQNSYTCNKNGTDRVAEHVMDRLGGILPSHRIIEQREIGNHHILTNKPPMHAVYLLGHLDTVFPPDHPLQKCSLEGNVLKGPGTADMKGGLAVIVFALEALKAVGLLDKLSLALVLSSDEEIGSVTSQSLLEQERKNALTCLVAECGGPSGEVVVSRNGKLGARLDCFGEGRHVGSGTHEKTSAILELAHKICALESLNEILPGTSINVGRIEGGLGPSTVPAHAFALLDVRWMEENHREALLEEIDRKTSEPHQPGCRTEFKVLNSRPAMPLHDGTRALLSELQRIGKSIGIDIKQEHRRGSSDANFFGSAGIPTLDGLGPVGMNDHTPDESIDVPSLKQRTALLALLLESLANKHF
ncbi:MAG: M20/M25/M40 family metallo-hydrolase [Candidatus Latescibacteria bacterium]|nr:M20/M25/M40 family metallo-hydrolase [Candidatus Latescibacterota bacterium]NIO57282.1 M20/M25/M40 family metallo-hydrolase [Candidatus Latescibacterota bacterium]